MDIETWVDAGTGAETETSEAAATESAEVRDSARSSAARPGEIFLDTACRGGALGGISHVGYV